MASVKRGIGLLFFSFMHLCLAQDIPRTIVLSWRLHTNHLVQTLSSDGRTLRLNRNSNAFDHIASLNGSLGLFESNQSELAKLLLLSIGQEIKTFNLSQAEKPKRPKELSDRAIVFPTHGLDLLVDGERVNEKSAEWETILGFLSRIIETSSWQPVQALTKNSLNRYEVTFEKKWSTNAKLKADLEKELSRCEFEFTIQKYCKTQLGIIVKPETRSPTSSRKINK